MNHRKSLTTNDIETGTYKKLEPNNLLKLIHLMKIHHELLDQCNTIICKETTKFILKNKPIFDKEKLKLYKLESIKQRLIEIGLYQIYIVENVSFDNKYKLNENTFFTEWNENAKKINKLFDSCIDNNNRHYNATSIYYKKDKKIIPKKNNIILYIIMLFFLIIIFCGLYVFNIQK